MGSSEAQGEDYLGLPGGQGEDFGSCSSCLALCRFDPAPGNAVWDNPSQFFSDWAGVKAGQAEVEHTRCECLLLPQLGVPKGIAAAPGAASSSSDPRHSKFSILPGFFPVVQSENCNKLRFPFQLSLY